MISSRSCRHTIIRIAIEAHAMASQRGVVFGTRHHVNVPRHAATRVGYIVLGLGWAVEGMVGFHVQLGTVLETHFALSFKDDEQFLSCPVLCSPTDLLGARTSSPDFIVTLSGGPASTWR